MDEENKNSEKAKNLYGVSNSREWNGVIMQLNELVEELGFTNVEVTRRADENGNEVLCVAQKLTGHRYAAFKCEDKMSTYEKVENYLRTTPKEGTFR